MHWEDLGVPASTLFSLDQEVHKIDADWPIFPLEGVDPIVEGEDLDLIEESGRYTFRNSLCRLTISHLFSIVEPIIESLLRSAVGVRYLTF